VALAVLGAAIWLLVHAARQVRLELIPPNLTVSPARAEAYVLLCLIVGALTMSLVQMWRTLVPVRGFYQRSALLRFFENGLRTEIDGKASGEPALGEFELRVGRVGYKGGRRRGFWVVLSPILYDLPIEQLCGQLSLAFENSMAAPDRFPNLLRGVLGPEGREPLAVAIDDSGDHGDQNETARNRRLLRQAEARATLSRMAQQRIDGFQIGTGGSWRRTLRVCVVGISVVFSWQATAYYLDRMVTAPVVVAFDNDPRFPGDSKSTGSDFDGRIGGSMKSDLSPEDYARRSWGTHLFQSVLMGLIAGYVAMVLRDLVAILELKRRQT
jgi:hypothetical protein